MLRWLWDHLSTLALAFVLAFVVWVAAVNAADPAAVRSFPTSLPIDYVGLQDGLVIVNGAPDSTRVTIRAPGSVWDLLTARDLHVEARLQGWASGRTPVTLVGTVDRQPARIIQIEPARLELTLEQASSRNLPIRAMISGEPALGYRMDDPVAIPESVRVSGPASLVEQVATVVAQADVTGRREDIDTDGQPGGPGCRWARRAGREPRPCLRPRGYHRPSARRLPARRRHPDHPGPGGTRLSGLEHHRLADAGDRLLARSAGGGCAARVRRDRIGQSDRRPRRHRADGRRAAARRASSWPATSRSSFRSRWRRSRRRSTSAGRSRSRAWRRGCSPSRRR